MTVKTMSYNTRHCLNHITREIDFDLISDTIKGYGVDIVGLQEIRNESCAADYTAWARILAGKILPMQSLQTGTIPTETRSFSATIPTSNSRNPKHRKCSRATAGKTVPWASGMRFGSPPP